MRASLLTSVAFVAVGSLAAHAATPRQSGLPAGFVPTIVGVDSHIAYSDGYGLYCSTKAIGTAMQYLGLTRLRDGIPETNPQQPAPTACGQNAIALANTYGLTFSFIAPDWTAGSISGDRANLDQLFTRGMKRGSVAALEGLNEINNESPQPTIAQATAWQAQILGLTRPFNGSSVDANVQGVPVYEFTSNGPVTPGAPSSSFPADYANTHPYYYGHFQLDGGPSGSGDNPLDEIIGAVRSTYGYTPQLVNEFEGLSAPAFGLIATESGAATEPYSPSRNPYTDAAYAATFDATTTAITDVRTILDAVAVGEAVDLYQLFANYPDPSENNQDDEYGLFTYAGQGSDGGPTWAATPAATAIHNLTSYAAGGETASAPVNCLEHTITGLPTYGHSLLVQYDGKGDYGLVLWDDNRDIWSAATHRPASYPPTTVTVGFAYPASGLVDDPIPGGAAERAWLGSSVAVQLGRDPLVIRIATSNASDTACR